MVTAGGACGEDAAGAEDWAPHTQVDNVWDTGNKKKEKMIQKKQNKACKQNSKIQNPE